MGIRFWPKSLIARILLVELGAILCAGIVLPTLMASLLHDEMRRYQVRTLTEQAQQIADSVAVTDHGIVARLSGSLARAYTTHYDGRAYVIADAAGQRIAASPYADPVLWRRLQRLDTVAPFREGDFVGVSLPRRLVGHRFWVLVTQDEAGPGAIIDDVASAFLQRYSPILLAILLLLPIVNSILIGRLIWAVEAASKRAQTIGPRNLDIRLDEEGLPAEVAPLAHATNALLERLSDSFRQQSEFVANVAHELRTPLTTLKVEVEAVHDDPLRDRLGLTIDRMTHVVAQLHDLAALEAMEDGHREDFDLVALAAEIIGDVAPRVYSAGDSIEMDAPGVPVMVSGNSTLAALALNNLLTNAIRHTPSGTAIRVCVSAPNCIEVSDDGPGIASSDPAQSTQRFWRADRQRTDCAGIGLSIVSRIMEVHDGELRVANRAAGGAYLTLIFPTAEDAARSARS